MLPKTGAVMHKEISKRKLKNYAWKFSQVNLKWCVPIKHASSMPLIYQLQAGLSDKSNWTTYRHVLRPVQNGCILLQQRCSSVNSEDGKGRTPLFWASQNGQLDVCESSLTMKTLSQIFGTRTAARLCQLLLGMVTKLLRLFSYMRY